VRGVPDIPLRSNRTVDFAGLPAARAQPEPSKFQITINDDGSVNLGSPSVHTEKPRSRGFDENLAETMDPMVLARIAEDFQTGVATDIMSRSEFISNYNKGVDLLGLKIMTASSTKGPRSSISQVKHPVLLEACVRYQSAARAELLPSAGPVKVMNIGGASSEDDQLAQDFENDFNYFLTDVAKEYYPDTDRALFYQGFGGSMYKKVFNCPLRRRPCSDSVQLTNLIVSEDAKDLDTAIRVTNEIMMSPGLVRRMQLSGFWVDQNLGYPQGLQNLATRKILESQGLAPITTRPQDQEHTIWEGYQDIDPDYYGFEERAPDRMPLPYRIVIDRDSKKVMELRRNWKQKDPEFRKRQTFVKFDLVPGLGFLGMGYLHLLGNQTRALTAIWQLLVDAGMLGNFPGGMRAKGVRMDTNQITPGLGEWVDVDLGRFDKMSDAFMAMPYKDVSAVFMQLAELIGQDAQRLAGAVDLEVGEGRANVPVGTIMAMIEQQTQVMGAVHKRNHTAQKEEFMLLRELFIEDPKALTRLSRKPSRQWETAEEFMDLDLSPRSDPNVPSQMHRIMQATAIETMATADPIGMDRQAVHKRTFRNMGISDGDTLLTGSSLPPPQPPPQQGPGPSGLAAVAKLQAELPIKQQQNQISAGKLQLQAEDMRRQAASEAAENANRQADREAQLAIDRERLQLDRDKLNKEHGREVLGMALDHVHGQQGLAAAGPLPQT
jgi:hypothetical protein